VLAVVFFGVSVYFVHRSFYGMRIKASLTDDDEAPEPGPSVDAGDHQAAVDDAPAIDSELVEQKAGDER